jgi:transcriptional regulator with XRE-family HTH domain
MSKRRDKLAISDALRKAVRESGLTMYRIAKESGVSFSTIQRFVTDKRPLSMANLDGLARYMKLELRKEDES